MLFIFLSIITEIPGDKLPGPTDEDDEVSISPTFFICFAQLFSTCFVIFCQKNIGAKAACKMLVKFTIVVDFTNIL